MYLDIESKNHHLQVALLPMPWQSFKRWWYNISFTPAIEFDYLCHLCSHPQCPATCSIQAPSSTTEIEGPLSRLIPAFISCSQIMHRYILCIEQKSLKCNNATYTCVTARYVHIVSKKTSLCCRINK